jgi:nicotinamide mononucleotide transporter
MKPITRNISWALVIAASTVLLIASWHKWVDISLMETWAFVTGAVCVLMCVEENVWNFPIGIANSVLFFFLFLDAKLFADMGLQIVYVFLGFQGWYQWLYSGENRSRLTVSRTSATLWVALAIFGVVATVGMREVLERNGDSAPFLDALTTVLSLIAQFLMNGKRLENWYVWITADVIYVGLYSHRALYLTAVLYAIFIVMCVGGYREWKRAHHFQSFHAAAGEAVVAPESEAV